MKTLINNISKLDKVQKIVLAISSSALIPCLVALTIDVIKNGSNL